MRAKLGDGQLVTMKLDVFNKDSGEKQIIKLIDSSPDRLHSLSSNWLSVEGGARDVNLES